MADVIVNNPNSDPPRNNDSSLLVIVVLVLLVFGMGVGLWNCNLLPGQVTVPVNVSVPASPTPRP